MELLDVTTGDIKMEKKSEGTCSLLDPVVIMVPLILLTLAPEGLRTTMPAPEAKATVYRLRTVTRLLKEIPILLHKWGQDLAGAGNMVMRHGSGIVVLPRTPGCGRRFHYTFWAWRLCW